MKKSTIALTAVIAIIGVLIIIKPHWFIGAIVIILGVESLANGLYGLFYVRKLEAAKNFQYPIIARSALSVIIGILAVFLPVRLGEAVWTAMQLIVAIHLIVTSALLLFAVGSLRDTTISRRPFFGEALISIAVAVLVLLMSAINVTRIIGIVVLLLDVVYFLVEFINRPIIDGTVEVHDDYDNSK